MRYCIQVETGNKELAAAIFGAVTDFGGSVELAPSSGPDVTLQVAMIDGEEVVSEYRTTLKST
jgi:hypothetical protein